MFRQPSAYRAVHRDFNVDMVGPEPCYGVIDAAVQQTMLRLSPETRYGMSLADTFRTPEGHDRLTIEMRYEFMEKMTGEEIAVLHDQVAATAQLWVKVGMPCGMVRTKTGWRQVRAEGWQPRVAA